MMSVEMVDVSSRDVGTDNITGKRKAEAAAAAAAHEKQKREWQKIFDRSHRVLSDLEKAGNALDNLGQSDLQKLLTHAKVQLNLDLTLYSDPKTQEFYSQTSRIRVREMRRILMDHYKKIYEKDGRNFLEAPIFQSKRAPTDRPMASRDSSKQRKINSAKKSSANKLPEKAQAQKKKKKRYMSLWNAMKKFKQPLQLSDEFIDIVGHSFPRQQQLKCHCCSYLFKPETLNKDTLQKHIKSEKHRKNKAKMEDEYSSTIAVLKIEFYDKYLKRGTGQREEQIPDEEKIFRFDLCAAYLAAGTPFSHFDTHRDTLSKYCHYKIPGRVTMTHVKDSVHDFEIQKIKEEIKEGPVAIIFDGTTRLGEAQAIIFRFVLHEKGKPPHVVQRLVALPLSASADDANKLAGTLHSTVSNYQLAEDKVVYAARDRCATNTKALHVLQRLGEYVNLLDGPCFSHTCNNAGNILLSPKSQGSVFPVLAQWDKLYRGVVGSKSRKPSTKFKFIFNEPDIRGVDSIRWFVKADNLTQKHRLGFSRMKEWVQALVAEGISTGTAPKLFDFLNQPGVLEHLNMEVIAYLTFAGPLRELCYRLEGDSELVFFAYDWVEKIFMERNRESAEWIHENNPKLNEAIQAVVNFQNENADPQQEAAYDAALNAWNAAKRAYSDGPRRDSGLPLRKPPTNHLDEAAKAAALAAYNAEYQRKADKLAADEEAAHAAYLALIAQAPPKSLQDWQSTLVKWVNKSREYFLHRFNPRPPAPGQINIINNEAAYEGEAAAEANFDNIDLHSGVCNGMLKIYEAARIANPKVDMEPDVVKRYIDYLFQNIPYFRTQGPGWQAQEKEQLMNEYTDGLREKFQQAAMPTELDINDECEVIRPGYSVPRIAVITNIETDYNGVKFFHVKWLSHMEHIYYQDENAVEEEGGVYIVAAERVSPQADSILELFAREEMQQYKAWQRLVKILVLLQPSSAAAERVFSLLTTMFSKKQRRTLQKFIFTAIAQRMHRRTGNAQSR